MLDALADYLVNFPDPMAYSLVFLILLACGLGVPIPEDITLFAAGYYCYRAESNIWAMVALCFAGVLTGDTIIFVLGTTVGRKLTQRWPFRSFLTPDRLGQVQKRLRKGGNKLVFAARFMPGLRAPVYFSAGMLHVPFRVFIFHDGLAALISVPAIVYTVFYFGHEVDEVVLVIKKVEYGIIATILAIVFILATKWYISYRKLRQSKV